MIRFQDWTIQAEGQVLARQYDNLTRVLCIQGSIPDGWDWDLLVQAGGLLVREPSALPAQGVLSAPRALASALRVWEGDVWLFLLNLSETETVCGDVCLGGEYGGLAAEEWDMTAFAEMGECPLRQLTFAPGQMRIFRLVRRARKAVREAGEPLALPKAMRYTLTEPNVLVLDRAAYSVDGVPRGEEDVLLLDRALRTEFGLPLRGGEMVQPWFAEKYRRESLRPCCTVRLTYTFFSEIGCDALVAAEYGAVTVNGQPASRTEGRWADGCFNLFRIRIREGKNEIAAEFPFGRSADIEAVYVLGQFGVKLPATVCPLPKLLSTDDLGAQGLPYYGGAVAFRTGISGAGRVRVRAEKLCAASLHVAGGGADEKVIAYAPYEAETDVRGELMLTLYLTRRNTFGPNHYTPQPLPAYGPEAWVSEGENRSDAPVLIRQGAVIAAERLTAGS